MRFALPVLLAFVLALGVSALQAPAQQTTPPPDVLHRLLDEVHQLRVAIERQASTGARVQLMASRLTVQDDRVYKLSTQLESVRRELASLDLQTRELAARDKHLDEALALENDFDRRRAMEQERKMLRSAAATMSAQQETLRGREQELLNALSIEQAKLDEVTRRFDELDRLLER